MRIIFLLISTVVIGLLAIMWLKLFTPSFSYLYSPDQTLNSQGGSQPTVGDSSSTNPAQEILKSTQNQATEYQQQVLDYQNQVINETNQQLDKL